MRGYKDTNVAGQDARQHYAGVRNLLVLSLVAAFIGVSFSTSCRRQSNASVLPDTSGKISFAVPAGWPTPVYTYTDNALTQSGFELGRKLFYDVRLSRDNTISCASCHAQFAAFSHLDHALSHGIDGLFGTRNAPGLFNMAWKPAFFRDGGVINLENQPLNPIENPVEMDEKIQDVVSELAGDGTYKTMFSKAFGDEAVNSQRIFKALAQFMAAMVSSNSRYDKHLRGAADGTFTDQEERGLTAFRAKCSGCHAEPLFSDFTYRSNGLLPDLALNDTGRAHITGSAVDRYKFMVPSLRNVNLTRPYMHDGRFSTLDAVLEHYRTSVSPWGLPDPLLATGIDMTDDEKADIIAFLKTLSDTAFTNDIRFAEPR